MNRSKTINKKQIKKNKSKNNVTWKHYMHYIMSVRRSWKALSAPDRVKHDCRFALAANFMLYRNCSLAEYCMYPCEDTKDIHPPSLRCTSSATL